MAKFLSQVLTIARGSVGGLTYTANQWAQLIMRARTSPVNPNTSLQTNIRSSLAGANALWVAATAQERALWSEYAETCIYSGPLGNYTITGRLMFIACLSLPMYLNARGLSNFTIDQDAPVKPGFYAPGAVSVGDYGGVTAAGIALDIQNETEEAGVAYIQRSFAFTVARNRFKGQFDTASAQSIVLASPGTSHFEFGDLTEDLIYFTHVRMVTGEPPFRISTEYILRHVAEAPPVAARGSSESDSKKSLGGKIKKKK